MGSAAPPSTAIDTAVTPELLEKCLQAPIISYTVKAGSSAGDNFVSVVHALNIVYKKNGVTAKADLMLKSFPLHPARRSFLDSTNMFQKELLVYEKLVPEITRFGRSLVPDFDSKFRLAFPPFINGKSTPPTPESNAEDEVDATLDLTRNFILMVDMRSFGFKMADKASGLDYAHCKLVFTELAKLHALNWAYSVKNGLRSIRDKFPFLKDDVFCMEQESVFTGMLGQNFERLKGLLATELGEKSDMYKGFLRFEATSFEILMLFLHEEATWDEEKIGSHFRVKPATNKGGVSWKCGSHGDMWVNNMLFRYAEGTATPVETVFVDLQIYRETSPLIDLAYFIYSSTTSTLRRKHLNDLLRLYSDVFLEKCRALGVDPFSGFSFSELQRRFHLVKLYGFVSAVMLLPIILVKPEEATDMDTVSADTTKFDDMFKQIGQANSDGLKTRVAELVRELYEEGLL